MGNGELLHRVLGQIWDARGNLERKKKNGLMKHAYTRKLELGCATASSLRFWMAVTGTGWGGNRAIEPTAGLLEMGQGFLGLLFEQQY